MVSSKGTGYLVLAAILLSLAVASGTHWCSKVLLPDESATRRVVATVFRLQQLLGDVQGAEAGQRAYLLTGRQDQLNSYWRAQSGVRGDLTALRALAEEDPSTRPLVYQLEMLSLAKLAQLEYGVRAKQIGDEEGVRADVTSDSYTGLTDDIRSDIQGAIRLRMQDQTQQAAASYEKINQAGVSVTVLTMIISTLLVAAYWLHRRYSARSRVIQYEATHDALTGLLNRRQLLANIDACQDRARRAESDFAVFYMDVDGFKAVNDSMGHEAGDHLLCSIAASLDGVTRHGDVLARIGGDEFVLLATPIGEPQEVVELGQRLIQKVKELSDAYYDSQVALSVGVATYSTCSATSMKVLDAADAAMYEAKRRGGNQLCFQRDTGRLHRRSALMLA